MHRCYRAGLDVCGTEHYAIGWISRNLSVQVGWESIVVDGDGQAGVKPCECAALRAEGSKLADSPIRGEDGGTFP